MYGTPAFHSNVIAYPAITVVTRDRGGSTRIAHRPKIAQAALSTLVSKMTAQCVDAVEVTEIDGILREDDPWILAANDEISIVRRLEREFPTLEEAGCQVGIGVATGADKVFIGKFDQLDVEPDRKLPLVMTRDINGGSVDWRGYGVVNPFNDDGSLVHLADYPKLEAYFERHGAAIRSRHVSKRNPTGWYRTIDRITPSLAFKPRLLIPDIKGSAHIVYENDGFYPHHNLYYIVSSEWDLKALGALLMSGIARLFVATYSTKMRGGFLRYQAQYLRRICIPKWSDVPEELRAKLVEAAEMGDTVACNTAAFAVYGCSQAERDAIGKGGTTDS